MSASNCKIDEWLAHRIGGPSATAWTVTAPNREAVLAMAYDKFKITLPAERKRVVVLRASDHAPA